MRRLILMLLMFVAGCAGPRIAEGPQPLPAARPPVILVSIDGFRPDYLGHGVTPNLDALAAGGVRATAMRPSFPSLTFPNHYTLVTGLRPDHHGVVSNTMEDAAIPGVRFSLSNREATADRRWWDAAEPVWVTAENAGIRTATMFWPGADAAIHGVRPAHWLPFDGSVPSGKRVDTLLGWIDGADHPGFATLYFDTVDHEGHAAGPGSPPVMAAVADVDAQVGRLLAGLKARGVAANIVVVSDHGMAATSPDRVILLDGIAPAGSFRLVGAGAEAGVEAMPGQEVALAAALLARHDHVQCWRKADVPARLAYGRNPRVPAFVCLPDVGWLIFGSAPKEPVTAGGAHGYDNGAPDMAALFIASGPAFRAGVVLAPFDNVDVYPLLMRLVGVPARPSDGSIASLAKGLR